MSPSAFHACQIPLPLIETLIKAATKEKDLCFILFGGSGSELVLCRQLERDFLSCEVHPEYYALIQNRLARGGDIAVSERLSFLKQKKKIKLKTNDIKPLFM